MERICTESKRDILKKSHKAAKVYDFSTITTLNIPLREQRDLAQSDALYSGRFTAVVESYGGSTKYFAFKTMYWFKVKKKN